MNRTGNRVGEAAISLEDTMEVEPVVAVASDEPIQVEPQPEPETVEISYSDISEHSSGTASIADEV